MSIEKWEKRIIAIQNALLWTVLVIVIICVVALLLFDSLAGTGIGYYMTRGNLLSSIVISLATSGLLTAVAFLGYMVQKEGYEKAGYALLIASVLFLLIDIYMDALGADILRYGSPVIVSQLAQNEKGLLYLYRTLIGGLSTVGEPLAFAIILGFPMLKGFLKSMLGLPHENLGYKPASRPIYNTNSPVMASIPRNEIGYKHPKERADYQGSDKNAQFGFTIPEEPLFTDEEL